MPQKILQSMAAQGQTQLCGTDLLLMAQPDPQAVLLDGPRLGRVIADTARRYHSPLAIQMMDLTLEKNLMLTLLDVPAEEFNRFQFQACPTPAQQEMLQRGLAQPLTPRLQALVGAIQFIRQKTDLLATGLCIGPFSFMTKMLPDPISPIFLAGKGVTAAEDESVRAAELILNLCTDVILRSVRAQIAAGAQAIVICEPAANTTYLSPRQLKKTPQLFEKFVLEPNRRLNALLQQHAVLNFFHDCGELTDEMLRAFCQTLKPALFSVGAPVDMAHAATVVPHDIVLMGNIPSKNFHAADYTAKQVAADAAALRARMQATKHPYLLGTECYVMSVKGREAEIESKVQALFPA